MTMTNNTTYKLKDDFVEYDTRKHKYFTIPVNTTWHMCGTTIDIVMKNATYGELSVSTKTLEEKFEKCEEKRKGTRWISVDERLPDCDEDVIVTDGDGYAVGFWREDAKAWDNCNFGWLERQSDDEHPIRLGKVTHWQRFEHFPGIE